MSESALDSLSSRLEALRWQVGQAVESLRETRLEFESYQPSTHGPLVGDPPQSDASEVERYWVNAPFSYISIAYSDQENQHQYRVIEPELSGFETELLQSLLTDVRDGLVYSDREFGEEQNPETQLQTQMVSYLEEYGVEISANTFYRLFYYLYRAFVGFDRIDPIMHDPHVEDVSCDGYGLPIFVYHENYADIETSVSLEEADLDSFVVRVAQHAGGHLSIGNPVAEVTLTDGSRAELALGTEVTPRGSAFTIRKYAAEPFTPVDLIDYGTFDLNQMAYLWLAIENNKSLLFAGGTASGKTTSMNAASMFVTPRSKVLTIEDTRELALSHDNWLSSITRESHQDEGGVTMYDLLRSALRHRPEYIVVGEVRGEEAITLFQAMNTGHTTFSTMHADSVQTAINRLENEPINVPRAMIQSLDILCVQTLTFVGEDRVRRNRVLAEIEGIDPRTGDLDYSTAFTWNASEDTFSRGDSQVLEEIADERGWSRSELLREFDRRKAVLSYLRETETTDYRAFTAAVNEYYATPERMLRRANRADGVNEVPQ